MPLGTLDRSPPPFFKQGPTPLTKLLFFGSLALLLMVADVRWGVTQPLRSALSVVLFPVQWVAQQPVVAATKTGEFLQGRETAQRNEQTARNQLLAQAARAGQVDQLILENRQLRSLLALRERSGISAQAAQVLYDAADPYTRKMILDKGGLQGVQAGAPVMDESGVLGQVTRVYPLVSELTLIINREHSVPVLNTRTGARGVAFGEASGAPLLELRYLASNADVEVGDLLSTSGVDGVFPPGIPVARVVKVERRSDSVFARILCEPQAHVQAAQHVMVVDPVGGAWPARPEPERPAAPTRKGGPR
jgi:rod shape-determining protein MreC